jgi:hypothetical protein
MQKFAATRSISKDTDVKESLGVTDPCSASIKREVRDWGSAVLPRVE